MINIFNYRMTISINNYMKNLCTNSLFYFAIFLIAIYSVGLISYLNFDSYSKSQLIFLSDEIFNKFSLLNHTDHYSLFAFHIITSMLWMLVGIIQFLFYSKLHRIFGYLYFLFGFFSALTSVPMAYKYNIHFLITLGSFNMFGFYLYTTYKSIQMIKNHNLKMHKYYNYLNYSIGVGSIIMRPVMFLLSMFSPITFINPYYYTYAFVFSAIFSFAFSILATHFLMVRYYL